MAADPRLLAQLGEWHLEPRRDPQTPSAYAELQALASLLGAPDGLLGRASADYERWLRATDGR